MGTPSPFGTGVVAAAKFAGRTEILASVVPT